MDNAKIFGLLTPARGMDWLREDIFRLIDLYRDRPCLWDNDHLDRRNRNVKDTCWNEITESLQVERSEVERKIKSLSTQFFREYKRKIKVESTPGCEHDFKSKWFAFEQLSFLSRRIKDRASYYYCASEEVDITVPGDDSLAEFMRATQINEFNNNNNNNDYEFDHHQQQQQQAHHHHASNEGNPCKKRKYASVFDEAVMKHLKDEDADDDDADDFDGTRRNDDGNDDESCHTSQFNNHTPQITNTKQVTHQHSKNKMPKIKFRNSHTLTDTTFNTAPTDSYNNNSNNNHNNHNNISHKKDEYSIYGEFVACKLRKLPCMISRCRLQRCISEAIFDAEMTFLAANGGGECGVSCKESAPEEEEEEEELQEVAKESDVPGEESRSIQANGVCNSSMSDLSHSENSDYNVFDKKKCKTEIE